MNLGKIGAATHGREPQPQAGEEQMQNHVTGKVSGGAYNSRCYG